MEVVDQGAQALVQQRKVLAQRPEVVAMMVPAAEGQRDATHAGLDQPTRHQELFHQLRAAVVPVPRVALAVPLDDARVFLLEVQRLHQAARSQNAERLLVVRIQPVHRAALVHRTPEVVHRRQQGPPVRQSVQRHPLQHHVLLAAPLVDLERSMGRPQEARPPVVRPRHVTHLRGQAHVRGHRRVPRTHDLAQVGPDRRPPSGRLVARMPSRMARDGVVPVLGAHHGPDDRIPVGELGHARQVLADANAGDRGGDGAKLAPDLRRRLLLQVEHVLMRRPPGQEDHDHRLVAAPGAAVPGGLLRMEQLGQRQPAHPQRANAQEVATRNAITITRAGRPWSKEP